MNNARLTGSYRVGLQTMKGYTGIEAALSELPTAEDGATYGYAFYAVDTNNTYLFNENTNAYELASSGGGGGGDTYAPLDSPAFTGTPTAPTAAAGTDTEQLATCAFVTDAINTAITEVENGTY